MLIGRKIRKSRKIDFTFSSFVNEVIASLPPFDSISFMCKAFYTEDH